MAKKILIIEDEKNMREIYKDIFSGEEQKYQIDLAGSIQSANEKIKDNSFDMIILDIIMKPVSGDVFYAHLKENLKTERVPILIISVLSSAMLGEIGALKSAVSLEKPVTKEQLLAKIDSLFLK